MEGLEEDSLDNDSYYSKDSLSFIPIVPDFGELPEKPVSEKSRKIYKKVAQLGEYLQCPLNACYSTSRLSQCTGGFKLSTRRVLYKRC